MSDPTRPTEESAPPAIMLDKSAAAHAVAWSTVYAAISKIIFPLGGIYITGLLGPAQVGIFMLLMTIVNFSEVLRDAGLTQSFLAEPEMERRREGAYFGVALFSGLIPAAVLFGLSDWLARFFDIPELTWSVPVISAVVVLNGVATIPKAKMLKDGHIKLSGLYEVIAGGIGLAIAIVMVNLGYGFFSMLMNFVFGAIFGLVVNWIRYPVRSCSMSFEAFRIVGKRSLAVLAANGINNLFLFADHSVINRFAGTFSGGLFGAATNLAYKPMDLLVFPLTRTLMVAFSQSTVDRQRLSRIYARALSLAIMVVLPMYVLFSLYAEPILYLFWKEKFMGSVPVLQAMSLYIGFRVMGNISGNVLIPAGKHFQTLYAWILGVCVTGTLVFFATRGASGPTSGELLMPIVWSFVVGAVVVYGLILSLALMACPPAGEDRLKLRKSVEILVSSSVIMLGIRLTPIAGLWQLGIACLVGPLVHLVLIGTILEQKPLHYMGISGIKRLWSSL